MDPNEVMVWVQVGQQLYAIGKGAWDSVRGAMSAADIDADNAQLDKVDAAYGERIARAEREAAGN